MRHLRQQPAESSSSSTGAGVLALGVAGAAVASAQAVKRAPRRQVVRQATAVAEKTFTKMPASVTWTRCDASA